MTTAPAAPEPQRIYGTTPTSTIYQFSSNGNGGLKILEWQVGYGTNPTTPQHNKKSSGTSVITGLKPATTYYIWSRGRNSKGWGAWSSRMSVRTAAGARVKIGKVWREAVVYVRVKGKWVIAEPWVKSGGKWKKTF
jgi:hypothetical protein